MRTIVPTYELNRRIAEQGRVRMGIKGAKGQPVKLKRFRFTSSDREAMDNIARLYGGTVKPWKAAPVGEQYEVIVTQAKIPIVLPPDALGGSPIYESWSGGGCLRRCDGIDCTLQKADNAHPDAEPAIVPCVCRAEHFMACKPTTRLNVVLAEIRPFGGVWRLETHGWGAAQELPGMVALVMAVQDRGLTVGYLEIQERQAEQGRKKFIVPAVGLPESMEALAAGAMQVGALARGGVPDVPALPAPEAADEDDVAIAEVDWYDEDVEIADAELVEDEPPVEPPPPKRRSATLPPWLKAMHAGIADVVKFDDIDMDADTFRHALVALVTPAERGITSSKDLTSRERRAALDLIGEVLAGDRRVIGVAEDGKLRLSQKRAEART